MTPADFPLAPSSALTDPKAAAALAPAELQALGLSEQDWPQVVELTRSISLDDPSTLFAFGGNATDAAAASADALLDQARNSDLDESGKMLTQVLNAARSVNLQGLEKRSRIPLIGALIDRLALAKDSLLTEFSSAREQIDSVCDEIATLQTTLTTRLASLDQMYDEVAHEYKLLGAHIAAGQVCLDQAAKQLAAPPAAATGPLEAERRAARSEASGVLEKRIADLRVMQQSALQTLPAIRMIQANNRLQIDKFKTIRSLTIPTWKRQFMLALSLNEQRNAGELGQRIDDATNSMLRRNAELLRTNSVEAAKSNQRLVIDVATLQHVQDTLLQTVQDVIKVQQEGVQARRQATAQIGGMRAQLQKIATTRELA
jgi:uncharacterized protein YaaN involved in tellurite resistance